MAANSLCPDLEVLAGLGIDATDGSFPIGLATHIENCSECRHFLERRTQAGLQSTCSSAGGLPKPNTLPRIEGFTIDRELGRGAMGVVYLAYRDGLSRPVALKLSPGGRHAGPHERRQWLREAEAASRVRHPNVVTLYETAESDDWFLLVLEYVPGGTLKDRPATPLTARDAARLSARIARAVHHIHENDQLHLDLKPSNILLDGNVNHGWDAIIPKVSDFGVARSLDPNATDSGGIGAGGSPCYMAPEQITKPRNEMTRLADIHGLGAILYQTLTGRPPYQGATLLETIDQVQRSDVIPPRRFSPTISRDLETICLKCLRKEPGRRYATALEVADDLDRWLDGRPITARPVSRLEKAARACRRRPVITALAAALILTLSVSFVTVTLLWRRAEANFRSSNESLAELVDLVSGGQKNLPRAMTLDHLIDRLGRVRSRLISFSASQPDDLATATNLARVEAILSDHLKRGCKHEEARNVLVESLERLEPLGRRFPGEAEPRELHRQALIGLAAATEKLGAARDGIAYRTRAVELIENQMRVAPTACDLRALFHARRELAWNSYCCGDLNGARDLVKANQRLLEEIPRGCVPCDLSTLRLLERVDFAELISGSYVATPCGKATAGINVSCSLSCLAAPTDASQSSDEWGRLAAQSLRCDDEDPVAAARRQARDAHEVMTQLTILPSRLRQVHDLEGVRRIGERMLALANHVAKACPDEPAAYLALSAAYSQRYKCGYDADDSSTIMSNMRLALEAAEQALLLDFCSEPARYAVDDLKRRLVDRHVK